MAQSRTRRSTLSQLLDSAPAPIYVLDERRRIVYCNSACAQWVGTTIEKLTGLRCDYHTHAEPGSDLAVGSGLCPPPEVFAGQSTRGIVAAMDESGGWRRRRASFSPLGPDVLQCIGVFVVTDITDLAESATVAAQEGSEDRILHERIRDFRRHAARRYHIDRLIGESAAIRRVRDQAALAASSRSRVLVVGPSGSGREHVARTIHYSQPQATGGSLVPMDCALLDSELLQTTVSAFVRRCAELEQDRPSALLLLDVDQLPADAQRDLVGFLDIHELELRTLATARQTLIHLAGEGKFRRDLACILSTLVIELPSLAERPEDIPLLAQFYLEQTNSKAKRQLGGFAPEAMDGLVAYSWPGNVDELIGLVQACHRNAAGALIQPEELPDRLSLAADARAHPPQKQEVVKLDVLLRDVECEVISRAIKRAKGNRAQAARSLGISRARLLRRISQLGLQER